jgi:tetratricopeptide (TPR) repeat protein
MIPGSREHPDTEPRREETSGRDARARMGMFAGVLLMAAAGQVEASGLSTPPRGRAYYLYSLSQQAQFQRNYVDALKFLEEALRSDDSPDLRVELADLYSSLNQNGQAEDQLRKALDRDGGNVDARRLLAQVLSSRPPEGEDFRPRLEEAETIYRSLLVEGKGDDDSALALADLLVNRGDEKGARSMLEEYRSSHGPSTSVDLELARICQQGPCPEEAITLLQGVVDREKDNHEARNLLGDALEDAGRNEEAAQVYSVLVEQNPGNPYGQYRLARALLSLRRYKEARDHLTVALQADPRNVRLLLALGQACEGVRDLKGAEDVYRQALDQDPGSMEARFFLARVVQQHGEDAEALSLYGEILARNSAQGSPQEKLFYSLAATQVGVLRLLQKNYSAALQSLGLAFQASENPDSRLYSLTARAHIESGDLDSARKILAEGLEKNPDEAELAAAEGEILLRSSRRADACRRFQELLDRAHGSEEAYLEVIQACVQAESLQDAQPWAREGLQKHPESRDLAFQDAALDERLGRFRQAERKLRALLVREPDDAETLNYLGYMLADRGVELEDALSMLEKAVALEPDNIAFLDSLGWVHFRLGRLEQAEGYLLQATRGTRIDPTILDHLGDVRAARGEREGALEAYRGALQHSPERPEEIRRKIRKLEKASIPS